MRLTAAILLAMPLHLCAVEVPPVPALPDPAAYAIAVVPDLRGLLADTERAMTAAGIPMPAGLLAMQVGGMLGDPGLAGLGDGPVVFAAAPGVMIPSWCAVLPAVKDPATLTALVTGAGLMAEAVPGGFAIGSAPDGPALARRILPAVPQLLAGLPPGTDLRAQLAIDRVVQAYLPMMLAMMQAGAPGQDQQTTAFLRGMLGIFRVAAAQPGGARLDLAVDASGWRLDLVHDLKPGPLADAVRPLPAGGADLLDRLGPGDGSPVMLFSGAIPPALYGAAAELLALARRDQAVAALVDEPLVALVRSLGAATDGRMAARMAVHDGRLTQFGVYGVRDAAATRTAARALTALMVDGAMGTAMRNMGTTTEVARAARVVGGTEVDRLTYTIDAARLPPGQAAEDLEAMLPPQELAVSGDAWLWGGPPAEVDAALAGPRQRAVLKSASAFGAGWDGYADYDLAVQMRWQMALMRRRMPFLGNAFADVAGGHPLMAAWAFGEARIRIAMILPVGLIADMRAGFEGMRMQPLPRDDAPAPAPVDPAAPVF